MKLRQLMQSVRRPCEWVRMFCSWFLDNHSDGVASAICHVTPWRQKMWSWVIKQWHIVHIHRSSFLHTCGKSLLAERKSVSGSLKLHVHSWQGAPLTHKLHCQSGGVWRTTWQFKLGPEGPSTWGQTQTITFTYQELSQFWKISNQLYMCCFFFLPSFSDFSEISISFHRHLLCSEFLKIK